MAYPILRNGPLPVLAQHEKKCSLLWEIVVMGLAGAALIAAVSAFPLGLLTFEGTICTQTCCISLAVITSLSLAPFLVLALMGLCFRNSRDHGHEPDSITKDYSLPTPMPVKTIDISQSQKPFYLTENESSLDLSKTARSLVTNQLTIPPEMVTHIFTHLTPIERIRCARVCRFFWSFNAGDRVYWKKICEEGEYLPEAGESNYNTFLRHQMWMSPRTQLGIIKTQPLREFKDAYLGSHLVLSSESEESIQLECISFEDGSSTLFRMVKNVLIQVREDKLFCIQDRQFSIYELPTFTLLKSVQLPFDRIGDVTQIGPDFFFISWAQELQKQKIMRLDSETNNFHELFVFQPNVIPRFSHNGPEGSITCVGYLQRNGIYSFDYQGNQRYAIQAPTHSAISSFIGSRFLIIGIENTVLIWDLPQKKCIRNFILPSHVSSITALKAQGLSLTICTQDTLYVAQLCASSTEVLEEG